MTGPIPNCPNALRWHNTLCQTHARQVPQSLQYLVGRSAAMLMRSKRPMMVQAWAQRYRAALRQAVAAVSDKAVA